MSQTNQLTTTGRDNEMLREAASRRVPVVLTCRVADGWSALKSRFLGLDRRNDQLVIEYPAGSDRGTPEIVSGQSIGVSFRRGHKKCVFGTSVVERCSFPPGKSVNRAALKLQWPESVYQLQRRLYHRAPVPEGITILVELWRGDSQHRPARDAPVHSGTVLDLSVGGISLTLSPEHSLHWDEDDPVTCSLLPGPGEPAITLYARLRYQEKTGNSHVRMGLQFVGLDSWPGTREALQRVIRLATRFQRIQMRRRGRYL